MKLMKKIMCMVLSAIILITCMPMPASAYGYRKVYLDELKDGTAFRRGWIGKKELYTPMPFQGIYSASGEFLWYMDADDGLLVYPLDEEFQPRSAKAKMGYEGWYEFGKDMWVAEAQETFDIVDKGEVIYRAHEGSSFSLSDIYAYKDSEWFKRGDFDFPTLNLHEEKRLSADLMSYVPYMPKKDFSAETFHAGSPAWNSEGLLTILGENPESFQVSEYMQAARVQAEEAHKTFYIPREGGAKTLVEKGDMVVTRADGTQVAMKKSAFEKAYAPAQDMVGKNWYQRRQLATHKIAVITNPNVELTVEMGGKKVFLKAGDTLDIAKHDKVTPILKDVFEKMFRTKRQMVTENVDVIKNFVAGTKNVQGMEGIGRGLAKVLAEEDGKLAREVKDKVVSKTEKELDQAGVKAAAKKAIGGIILGAALVVGITVATERVRGSNRLAHGTGSSVYQKVGQQMRALKEDPNNDATQVAYFTQSDTNTLVAGDDESLDRLGYYAATIQSAGFNSKAKQKDMAAGLIAIDGEATTAASVEMAQEELSQWASNMARTANTAAFGS